MPDRQKKCQNCGYRAGLHHSVTGQCPDVKPIPCMPSMTGVYGYLTTIFCYVKKKEELKL